MNLSIILTVISLGFADELSDCKCPEGYRPQLEDDGHAMCYGIYLRALAPCNLIKTPSCQCGPEATVIVNDASGVWCVSYNRRSPEKRWHCENKEEWESFFHQHPNMQRANGRN